MSSDTQYSLRWNNFGPKMTSALNMLHQVGDFVDVTLAVSGMQMKAHKVVLSACSPYFRNILKKNPCQHPVIILRDVSVEDVSSILSFMYEGHVNVTQTRLRAFMRLAEALQIRGLTEANWSSSIQNSSNDDVCRENKEMGDTNCNSLDLSMKSNDDLCETNPQSALKSFRPQQSLYNNITQSDCLSHAVECALGDAEATAERDLARPATKRRRLSSSNSRSSRNNMPQALLEVKLEPDEFANDSKDQLTREGARNVQEEPWLTNENNAAKAEKRPCFVTALRDDKRADHQIQTQKDKDMDNQAPEGLRCRQRDNQPLEVPKSKERGNQAPEESQRGENNKQTCEAPQNVACQALPFPCPFCEKAYTSWGFRRRHVKGVHATSRRLSCKWCATTMSTRADWQSHVTTQHSLAGDDARQALLVLDEAHMVLQVQPTRVHSIIKVISEVKSQAQDERRESGKSLRRAHTEAKAR